MKLYSSTNTNLSILKTLFLSCFLIVISTKTHAQTNCSLGNPVFKEDFGSGTNRLGSSLNQDANNVHPNFRPTNLYAYVGTGSVGQDQYGIIKDPKDAAQGGADWNDSFKDHTGDLNGYFYYCDAKEDLNVFYAQKISGVCPEIEYELSAWFAKTNAPDYFIDPNIKLIVGFTDIDDKDLGVIDADTGSIEGIGENRWHRKTLVFTIPKNTENVYFMLKNNVAGIAGNDLAIDDIEIRPCGPEIEFTDSNTNNLLSTGVPICINNPNINITSNITNNYVMQWQESIEPNLWVNIPNEASTVLNYELPNLTSFNHKIRLQFAHNQGNLQNSNCYFYSDEIYFNYTFTNVVGDLEICDNIDDGNGENGIVQNINLESQTATVLGPNQSPLDFEVSYHTSIEDANSDLNNIISPYENKVPYSEPIYVRVYNMISGCVNTNASFNINVHSLPTANPVIPFEICDDLSDGNDVNGIVQNIDLKSQASNILGSTQSLSDFTVTYHLTKDDSISGNNSLTSPYENKLSPHRQTIWVRVLNNNTLCVNSNSSFELIVNPLPIVATVSTFEICDNLDDGNGANGIVQYIDLDSKTTEILKNTQNPDVFTVSYHLSQYDADLGLNQLFSPYDNLSSPYLQKIFVRVQNKVTLCVNSYLNFNVVVHSLPTVNQLVQLKQCDVDSDGFSIINLTEVEPKISSNFSNETFTYYTSLIDATNGKNAISDPTSYINQKLNLDAVWVRTISEWGCFRISEIEVIVTSTFIPLSFQHEFFVCDDYLDLNGNDSINNNDRDGVSSFDFSHLTNEVINQFPLGHPIKINYYRNESDALSELNPIIDLTNYRNIGYPNTQNIFIRVDSEINNDCLGFGHYITLNVENLPVAHPIEIKRQCSENKYTTFPFDVGALENNLLQGQKGVTITYFDEKGNGLPSPLPNPFLTSSQNIRVKVTNNTTSDPFGPCFDETIISFVVDVAPIAFPIDPLEVCDADYDGVSNFDTSNIQNTILNTQSNMEVYYFDEGGNPLSSPLPNPFTTGTHSISYEVVNPNNPICKAYGTIYFIVNPKPIFSVENSQILCVNDPLTPLELSVHLENPSAESYSYSWMNDIGTELSPDSKIEVTNSGMYYVTLSKMDGTGCSHTESIEVLSSSIADSSLFDVDIIDDSDNNIIRIISSNEELGLGDYEFAIDTDFIYQDEPIFDYVEPGFHTLFIRDKNGCGTLIYEVSIMGFPKFFTPNFDGYNDTWKVLGLNDSFYSDAKINIFDRFGKLLKQMGLYNIGWDGYLNGKVLPSSDYWFVVELTNFKGNTRIRKGHFSLIR